MSQGTPKDILLSYLCHKHHSFKFKHWTEIKNTSYKNKMLRVFSRYLINYTLIWIYWVKFSLWTIILVTRIEHRSIADKFRNPWALIAKENNVPYSVGFGFLFLFDDNKVRKSVVLDCFKSFNDSPSRSVQCQYFNRFCSYDPMSLRKVASSKFCLQQYIQWSKKSKFTMLGFHCFMNHY